MINEPLLRECIAAIEANPEKWNQASYECGTTWCLAGWAIMLSNPECESIWEVVDVNGEYSPFFVAKDLLGLDLGTAHSLFESSLFVLDLYRFKKLITEKTGVEFKDEASA